MAFFAGFFFHIHHPYQIQIVSNGKMYIYLQRHCEYFMVWENVSMNFSDAPW